MSSPDPLNDVTELIPPSSSRRVTRSHRSQRFASVAGSPRKQMFELQVGDTRSPQKLWVTVETDNAAASAAGSVRGPRRKLFQSPAPTSTPGTRRRAKAITTTVPLRDSVEEEPAAIDALATPKRRGRPRKSNGTPMPSAAKRRATTPSESRTPRRRRITKTDEPLDTESRASVQPTPKSARRGRPPKDRSVTAPQSESETPAGPKASPTKRTTRRTRLSPVQDLISLETPKEDALLQGRSGSPVPSEDRVDLIVGPERDASGSPAPEPAHLDDDQDSDIWMATMSDQATPRPVSQSTRAPPSPSPPRRAVELKQPEQTNPYPNDDGPSEGDYVDLVPAASDDSSVDEPADNLTRRGDDTIAQGEDFSMIFMDSIPSLQGIFNSSIPPVAREELGEETSIIINNTLQSLRQSAARRDEPENPPLSDNLQGPSNLKEFAPADEAMIFDEPTPKQARSRSPSRRGSPRLFSSPRKAAGSSPLRRRVLKLTAAPAGGSGSSIPEMNDLTLNAEHSGRRQSVTNHNASHAYDDSFSQIPQEVLSAAVPGQPRDSTLSDDHFDDNALLEPDEQFLVDDEQRDQDESNRQQPALASNASTMSKSEAGRLPTPDDTPPQAEYQEIEEQAPSEVESPASSRLSQPKAFESGSPDLEGTEHNGVLSRDDISNPVELEESGSRSPRTQDPAQDLQALDLEEPVVSEPANLVSQSQIAKEPAVTESEASFSDEEPELVKSPEAAAASTISADAPSARQSPSPINIPQQTQQEQLQDKTSRPTLSAIVRAGKALQSITSDPPSPDARDRQLGSPFRSSGSRDSWNGSKDSQGSKRASKSPQPPFGFAEGGFLSRSPARDDPFGPTSKSNGQAQFLQALGKKGTAKTVQSSSRLSPGDSVRHSPSSDGAMSWIAREGPISPRVRGDNTLQEAARLSTTGSARTSSLFGRRDVSAEKSREEASEMQDDETDIWEFEARRETPQPNQGLTSGRENTTRNKNSGIEPDIRAEGQKGGLAISGIAAEAPVERLISPGKEHFTTATQASELDEYSQLAQRKQQEQPKSAAGVESTSKAKRFDLSSFFSSPAAIPGILAQKFLPGKATALFAASTSRPQPAQAAAPVLPTSSMFPSLPQARFPSSDSRPGSTPSSGSRLNAGASSSEAGKSVATQSSPSPATPERRVSTMTREVNVTPRQTSRVYTQVTSHRQGVPVTETPPRMQLSHDDIYRWRQAASNAGTNSPPPGLAPLLRPLPPRNASPVKSSLRSPLKPHTPGRVVEFTSSVLSPAEQAKARHERRLSQSMLSQQEVSPTLPQGQVHQNPLFGSTTASIDKQDHVTQMADDVAMDDAPPLAIAQPAPAPLSQTVWTRKHWLLLDEILHLRRCGPFEVRYEQTADRYLGKTVKSQGEAMRLQRWHLDCVDAFHAVVGGWDAGVLAKRLFALILGEERRKRGLDDRPAQVMFH